MRYIMNDTGEIFDVDTSVQLVDVLRETSWDMKDTREEWLVDTAARYSESHGVTVVGTSPDAFVRSLIASGMMKEKED